MELCANLLWKIKHFYIRPQNQFFQNVISNDTDLITRISDRTWSRDKFSELIEKEWAAHTTSSTGNFYPADVKSAEMARGEVCSKKFSLVDCANLLTSFANVVSALIKAGVNRHNYFVSLSDKMSFQLALFYYKAQV